MQEAAIVLIKINGGDYLLQLKDSNFPEHLIPYCARKFSCFGGKMESGENALDVLQRELIEELDLEVEFIQSEGEFIGTWVNGATTRWHCFSGLMTRANFKHVFEKCTEGIPVLLTADNVLAILKKENIFYPGVDDFIRDFLKRNM